MWAIKPIVGLDPDECDHDHEPWIWGNGFGVDRGGAVNSDFAGGNVAAPSGEKDVVRSLFK